MEDLIRKVIKKEYSKMIEYVEALKYKYDGEVEEVEKLNKLIDSEDYCAACFHGEYPTKIPKDLRKDRFERKLSERV